MSVDSSTAGAAGGASQGGGQRGLGGRRAPGPQLRAATRPHLLAVRGAGDQSQRGIWSRDHDPPL